MIQPLFTRSAALGPWLLFVLCFLIALLHLNPTVEYSRTLITQGEVYRLLSGNFAHSNWAHLAMNMGAVLVLWLLHSHFFTLLRYWLVVASLSVICALCLYVFEPSIGIYVGLSGTLHGMVIYGALHDIKAGEKTGYLLLLGTLIKVAYEQYAGASADVAALIESRVAIEAHLYGALAGLVIGVSSVFKSKKNPSH